MVRIITVEDCGNAPKKQIIRDFLTALAERNTENAVQLIDNEICLHAPNQSKMVGLESVMRYLQQKLIGENVEQLKIDNILSHGNQCAANGSMNRQNGTTTWFSAFFLFDGYRKNAKIKEITLYTISSENHMD